MTEIEAKSIIETEVKKSVNSFNIDVVSRVFIGCTKYQADIVVILKDDVITHQTLKDLTDYIMNEGIEELKIVGTKKDLRDLDFEILTIEAEIII